MCSHDRVILAWENLQPLGLRFCCFLKLRSYFNLRVSLGNRSILNASTQNHQKNSPVLTPTTRLQVLFDVAVASLQF